MSAIDSGAMFANDQIFPASATTTYSDYEIDFEAGKDAWGAAVAKPAIGQGSPLYFCFVVTEVGATGDGATIAVNLVNDTTSSATTAVRTIVAAGTAAAAMTAGYKVCFALQSFPALARYMRVQTISSTGGFTTGKYAAWLSPTPLADI
jgi:hypothetical protein